MALRALLDSQRYQLALQAGPVQAGPVQVASLILMSQLRVVGQGGMVVPCSSPLGEHATALKQQEMPERENLSDVT